MDALPADEPPPSVYTQTPSVAWKMPLHPNFWWSLLWCVAMLLMTQVLGGIVAIVVVAVAMVFTSQGGAPPLGDPSQLMDLPIFQVAIGLGLGIAHVLMIFFSLVILRIVAGRDWHREVAVRRPSLAHVGLVLIGVPAFIILANGSYFVVQEVLEFPSFTDLAGTVAFLGAIVASLVVMGFFTLFVSLVWGFDWATQVEKAIPRFGAIFLAVLGVGLFVGLTSGLYKLFVNVTVFIGVPRFGNSDMTGMMQAINSWPLAIAVFLIAVMPGFSEELWCRAYLGRGLVGKHGYFWGVLLTSFLFGLIHIDPRQGTMAMVLGVVLHYVYLMTRSLWVPILLHFVNNALAVILSRIPTVSTIENSPGDLPVGVFISAAFLLLAVCWALYESRARLVMPEGVPHWKPEYPGVACPPAGDPTIVATPLPSLVSVLSVVVALGGFVVSAVFAYHQLSGK
jgi:membrane protease YdiL (CAAX protease family)